MGDNNTNITPYDWSKIIKIDDAVTAEHRTMIETVLNDMANDEHGIKIFKKMERRQVRKELEPLLITDYQKDPESNLGVFATKFEANFLSNNPKNKSEYLVLNFDEIASTLWVDVDSRSFYQPSLNCVISHELVHPGYKKQPKLSKEFIEERQNLAKMVIDHKKKLEDHKNQLENTSFNQEMAKESVDIKKLNEEIHETYVSDIKKLNRWNFKNESRAIKFSNPYVEKYNEPLRDAYYLQMVTKTKREIPVLSGNDTYKGYTDKISVEETQEVINTFKSIYLNNDNKKLVNDLFKDLKKLDKSYKHDKNSNTSDLNSSTLNLGMLDNEILQFGGRIYTDCGLDTHIDFAQTLNFKPKATPQKLHTETNAKLKLNNLGVD